MKPKQLIIPGAILAGAILLAVIFSAIRNSNVENVAGSDTKQYIFKSMPIDTVRQFSIQGHGEAPINIEVNEDQWTVRERGGYPADKEKVGKLLRESIWDLGYLEVIQVGPSKYGRVGLLEPAAAGEAEEAGPEDEQTNATIVSLKNGEAEEVGALWIGKKVKQRSDAFSGENTVGRFVKTGDAETVYSVDEQFNDLKTEPKEWLDKTFFKVSKIKTIERVSSADAALGWKLTREEDTGDYTLVDAKEDEELDQTKVSSMKSAFGSPSFEDVLVGDDVAKPETVTFNVETFEGFKYVVKVNEKDDVGNYNLTVDVSAELNEKREPVEGESEEEKNKADEAFTKELKELKDKLAEQTALAGHVYETRNFFIDSINKDRAELMKEEEEPAEDPGASTAPPGLNNIPGLDGQLAPPAPSVVTPPPAPSQTPSVPAPPAANAAKGKGKADAPKGAAAKGKGKGKGQKGDAPKGKGKAAAPKGNAPAPSANENADTPPENPPAAADNSDAPPSNDDGGETENE